MEVPESAESAEPCGDPLLRFEVRAGTRTSSNLVGPGQARTATYTSYRAEEEVGAHAWRCARLALRTLALRERSRDPRILIHRARPGRWGRAVRFSGFPTASRRGTTA